MGKNAKKLNLLDLIDIEFLQKFQNSFARATGVGAIIVDEKGPLTKPSNFNSFCQNTIKNIKGHKKCLDCDLKWGEIAAKKKEPVVYTCFAGLTVFVVPIIVEGNYVAAISGGLVFSKNPDEKVYRALANELGIDEEKYLEAVKKVPVVPEEKIKAYADLLFIVANSISQIAHKRFMLVKKTEEESISRKIVEKLRGTLDAEEIKKYFINIVGNYFKADRCLFVDFDKETNKFLPFRLEKLKSSKIKTLVGFDTENDFPEFCEKLKRKRNIVIKDLEKTLSRKNLLSYKAINSLKRSGTKSDYGMLVEYKNQIIGILIIHFVNEKKVLNHSEFDFLKLLRDHVGTALYHAELYETAQKNVEKETLLRNIIETIRTSLDIKETKRRIVELIGKTMNADRCYIVEYDSKSEQFLIIQDEYLSSDDIGGYTGVNVNIELPNFAAAIKRGELLIINDKEIFLNSEEKTFAPERKMIEKYKINSAFAFPLYYAGELLGTLSIHYVKNQHIIEPYEINFIRTIADQISTAIHQARLYEKTQRNTEREKVIRTIIEKAISTENEEEIINTIVTEEGKFFKADRCFFIEYSPELDTSLPVKQFAEYLSSTDVKSHSLRPPKREEIIDFLTVSKQNKMVAVENVQESNLADSSKRFLADDLGVKSFLIAPVFYSDKFYGSIVLHYVKDFYRFTSDEIMMAHLMASQSASTIYQAKLNLMNKVKAQREKVLRNIISAAISNFDFSSIKQMVIDVGKITRADRCYFVEVDLENYSGKTLEFDREYLASTDIKTIIGYQFPEEDVRDFIELYTNAKDLVVFDYENLQKMTDVKYDGIKKYSSIFDLKSGVGIPFIYEGKPIAVLCIEYVKEKILPQVEELDFLRTLGQQVGIAYTQIKLYNNLKKTVEREILLRQIIETLRSSLELVEIKKKVIYELGKAFKADRCYFRSYDKIKGMFLAPDVEYLSSTTIKSLLDVVPNQEGLKYFTDEVARRQAGFYPVVADAEFAKGTPLESYMRDNDIKADYAMPIIDREDELSWLVLHYSKEHPHLSKEDEKVLETIAYQIDIAFGQIKLYNIVKQKAEKENLLRKIYETMRSSLDINVIKNTIVNEVGVALDADICAILSYNSHNDKLETNQYSEYKSSPEENSYVGYDLQSENVQFFINALKKYNQILGPNIEDFIKENNLEGTPEETHLREYKIKSGYGEAIFYADTLFGYIIIHYTKKYRELTKDELEFLKIITTQAGIAFYQANLYQKIQKQAEREKINRNIIEILRSSFDKNYIKNIFVRTIGNFFKADRVFLSEYDSESKMYKPVETGSEFLSSSSEKSFVGYDWSSPEVAEYINPILEKKELNIPNWNVYIKNNFKSQDFISLFEGANVKSSYNFPILYQERLMGYFRIEFTQRIFEMDEDDITLIRSICRQCGIALYQAELYQKAQCTGEIRENFIGDYMERIKESLKGIINLSESSQDECIDSVELLEKINKLSKNLFEIINEIS